MQFFVIFRENLNSNIIFQMIFFIIFTVNFLTLPLYNLLFIHIFLNWDFPLAVNCSVKEYLSDYYQLRRFLTSFGIVNVK